MFTPSGAGGMGHLMTILYKLTDSNNYTALYTQWKPGITVVARERGRTLCTGQVLHAYRDPVLAILMNPLHADFKDPKMLVCEGHVVVNDGTKVGCKSLKAIKWTKSPEVTKEQMIRFAILSVLMVYDEKKYIKWANKWLSGKDRTPKTALKVQRSKRKFEPMTYMGEALLKAALWSIHSAIKDTDISAALAAASALSARKAGIGLGIKLFEMGVFDSPTTKGKKIDLVKLAHKAVEDETY